jgi:hypothetical protein
VAVTPATPVEVTAPAAVAAPTAKRRSRGGAKRGAKTRAKPALRGSGGKSAATAPEE